MPDTGGPQRLPPSGPRHQTAWSSSEAYWHVGGVVGEVRQVLDQARGFVAAGDGDNALVILETSAFFGDLGPVWTETLLTADLTPEERRAWAKKLAKWQNEVDAYGLGLEGPQASLAAWLADLALGMGETGRALEAAGIAFREDPDLPAYLGEIIARHQRKRNLLPMLEALKR